MARSLPPTTPRKGKSRGSSSGGNSSGSNKAQKGKSTDTPSGSSNNASGFAVLNQTLRSVLSHPLALPLFCAFNDDNNTNFASEFKKEIDGYASAKEYIDLVEKCEVQGGNQFGTIFEHAVDEFRLKKKLEPQLTKSISKLINERTQFEADSEVVFKN
jgi:hypothetical protein